MKIFLILILYTASIYGQGIIKGLVSDSLTADQLKGAEIILTGTSFSTVSNTNGEFNITGIPAGDYILQTTYFGYKEKKILVTIKPDKALTLNINLLPVITAGDKTSLTDQAKNQDEEINLQLSSNIIKNVISGEKLQDMPDENIPVTLSRLLGVSIMYNSVWIPPKGTELEGPGEAGFQRPTQDDFTLPDDPAARILIRGLDAGYYNVTINGIRIPPGSAIEKSIDLNNISGRDFQNIDVRKTITSDEDADATAGAINMITEKAPYKRVLKFEALGNYNKLDKSGRQYNFTGMYGERFLNNKLGIRADAHIEKKIMSNESQNSNDDIGDIYFNIGSSYTNSVRDRNGANLLLDYITPDGGSITFHNIFNRTNTDNFESARDTAFYWPGSLLYRQRKTEHEVFLSSLGGSNHIFGFDVDWNAAFSESRDDHPYDYSLSFAVYSHSYVPISQYGMQFSLNIPTKSYSKEKTLSLDIHKKYALSNDITGELKFGGKYRVNSRYYYEYSRMDSGGTNGDLQYRRLADGTLVMKDFSGTRFDSLAGKHWYDDWFSYFQDNPSGEYIGLGNFSIPLISHDAMNLWRQLTFNEYYANAGPDINSYDMSQNVSAGYIMHTFNFRGLAIFITGLRIENEQNDYSGYYFPDIKIPSSAPFDENPQPLLYNQIPQKTRTFHYNKTSILPNFQMILKPTGFMNLRLAAYKTLIRPPSSARMPKYINLDNRGRYYLNMGNPDLKNADVWNYEFQTQFYGNDIGQFSVDAFYKNIEGMVQATNGDLFVDSNAVRSLGINWLNYVSHFPSYVHSSLYVPGNFSLYSYYNSTKPTHIWGFEIAHQASFSYLPGLLKNIVLNYNFTFLRSESWITYVSAEHVTATAAQNSLAERKQTLTDMPRFFANVNLGYDIKGFSFRISYFYQDEYPMYDGINPLLHIERNRFSRLDIAVRQQILKHIFINLNFNNITNSKEEAILEDERNNTNWTAEAYRYGMNIDLGIGIDL